MSEFKAKFTIRKTTELQRRLRVCISTVTVHCALDKHITVKVEVQLQCYPENKKLAVLFLIERVQDAMIDFLR